MKVIFLDYDGVLNNPYFLIKVNQSNTSHLGIARQFDLKKVEILAQACKLTNANIVVSSSWRHNREAIKYLKRWLPILGTTPSIKENNRDKEIKAWLEKYHPNNYVILDDETSEFSEELMSHLICTRECYSDVLVQENDYFMGLQPKHIKIIKSMLEE